MAVARAGESSIRLTYRLSNGVVEEQIVYRLQEPDLGVSTPEMGRPFDADGVLFRSVAEARRIQLAYLFPPLEHLEVVRAAGLPEIDL